MISIVSWTASIYVAYCGILFFMQRQMMFPRDLIGPAPEIRANIPGMETKWLDMPGGRVETWYLPPIRDPGAGPAPAVIFAHGNGELIDFWPETLQPLTRMGLGVLLVEYPGYGRSMGSPSQTSIVRAFVAAYDWLAARSDVDESRIVLFGRSLGGGAVSQLAARRPAAAMIFTSTFTSARWFTRRYLVPGFLMRDPFDNLPVIREYHRPVLIAHGRRDGVVPFDHARQLAEAAPRGTLLAYDVGHNDFPPNWPEFWREVAAFLREADILPREAGGAGAMGHPEALTSPD
jgi:fermentation-respiration switch protein FrsA (DUF1100 family)